MTQTFGSNAGVTAATTDAEVEDGAGQVAQNELLAQLESAAPDI